MFDPCFAQLFQGNTLQIEIDCLAERMLTELGHTTGSGPQHVVGLWRPVPTHDLDWTCCARFVINLVNKVEQRRIHMDNFVPAPITQNVIQLGKAILIVHAIMLERDDFVLAGMQMINVERPRFSPYGLRGSACECYCAE